MRFRAIVCAIFYGITPFWFYEDEPHYAPISYFSHLSMNIVYGLRWLTFHEGPEDRQFEREVNGTFASEQRSH